MKISKFFAAFLGATAFVACTQEEIVSVGNTPQEMEKVVGARLVGTDVSLNAYVAGSESATRWAGGTKGWESGDIVGLGWLVQEKTVNGVAVPDISGTQSETATPQSYLYANHMYEYDEVATKWGTKGNLYEGWYFGYYPWSYEEKAGKMKSYVLNPDMLAAGSAYHVSQSLYLTNRQFIDADEDLDVETNSLKPSFEMYQAVKFIQVTTNPEAGSAFADDEKEGGLDELPIKSISISVGDASSKIFAESVRLSAKNLPVKVEYPAEATTEEKAAIDVLNLKNFREAYDNFMYNPVWGNAVARNVEAAGHSVSTENARVYFNVIPGVKSFEAKDVTITVVTGGGNFIISGEKSDELSAINKAAIDALVGAYQKGGVLSTINELDEAGNPKANLSILNLNIELCDENYSTDFTKISTFEQWKSCVNSVQTLKRSEATFNIVGDIEFTDEVLMPTNTEFTKLTVTTDSENPKTIVLKGKHTGLPANLDVAAVDVVVEGTLLEAQTITPKSITNNGIIEVSAGSVKFNEATGKHEVIKNTVSNVINNGTIKLGEYAEVKSVTNNKRIEVVYGSFVTELSGDGQIAYMVKPEDKEDPRRVQRVINESNDEGAAQVNTLVFNAKNDDETANISEFDFTYATKPIEGTYDPYLGLTGNTSAEALVWNGLGNVSLEIDGVNVYSSKENQTVTVDNVTLANADLGQNISVDGDLTITEGSVKAITNGSIGGDLIIEDGTVVVEVSDIKGALKVTTGKGSSSITSANGIGSVDIKAGNFTINANTIEGDVVATGENYFNVAEFNGDVTMTNSSSNAIAIEGAEFASGVTLTGTYGLVNTAIAGYLTITGGTETAPVKLMNVTVEGSVTVKKGYVVANDVNITGGLAVEAGTYTSNAEGDTNIANIVVKSGATLNANNNVYVETIAVYGTVKVATGKTIWYTVPAKEGGYIQEGTTTGRVKSTNEYAETVVTDLEDGKDVTLETDIVLDEGLTISKDVTINLNGKTLKNNATKDGWITSEAKLTIKNGSMNFDGTTVWAKGGELNLIDCEITERGTTAGDCVYVSNNAKVVISDCSIKATGKCESPNKVWYGIGVVGGNVTVTNTTVEGFHGGITAHTNSTLNIDGGKFVGSVWHGLNIQETGVVVSLNNKPEFVGPDDADVQVYKTTATINGVTFDEGIYTQEKVYEKLEAATL